MWDKIKERGLALVSQMWEAYKRARGAKLSRAEKAFKRAKRKLRCPNGKYWVRSRLLHFYQTTKRVYELLLEKALWEKAEAKQTSQVFFNGKVNNTFFRPPARKVKNIRNMSISDLLDQPNEARTDDLQTIMVNFNRFYTELYSDRAIDKAALQ